MAGAPMLDVLERDPHAALRELREREGPVAWVDALGAWLVLTRERALEVMRDDATFTVQDPRFTTGRVVGPSMLTLDGAEHARHREPFARPFRRAAVLERFTAARRGRGRAAARRGRAGRAPTCAVASPGRWRRRSSRTRWGFSASASTACWAGTTRSSAR